MKKAIFYLSIFLFIFLILSNQKTYAAPARSVEEELKQPSGEKFKATSGGDEWFNWVEAADGDLIVKDNDQYWYYAELNQEGLKKAKAKYKIDKKPADIITKKELIDWMKKNNSKLSKPNLPEINSLSSSQNLIWRSIENSILNPQLSTQAVFAQAQAAVNTQKVLVLLVSFTDATIQYSEGTWSTKFFGTSGNSLRNYYNEVSNGTFYFTPAEESYVTTNNGVIKVALDYAHPNTAENTDSRNQKIVSDALQAADPYINYASFDINANGAISNDELHIVTVIAGYERSYSAIDTPTVWGHRWNLYYYPTTLDGVALGDYSYNGGYTQQGEKHGNRIATIGIFAHELGHDLGLPDLYDTDNTSLGVGIHSLMAGGSWGYYQSYPGDNPTHLDPWSKSELGFVNPIVLSNPGIFTLNAVATGNYNIFKIPTQDPNEYFLLENRQFSGFDIGLKYAFASNALAGIAIWHIDESVIDAKRLSNSVNNDENHKGVDLEEANQVNLHYSQLDSRLGYGSYDHYYRNAEPLHRFAANTIPNSNLYSGTQSGVVVRVPSGATNSMQIITDETAPTGSVNINNSDAYTNTATVSLTLSASDNSGTVAQMQLSNDGVNWSSWEAYVTTKSWTLTAGYAEKTVYARFKDAAANVSEICSDSITLIDNLPPSQPTGFIADTVLHGKIYLKWNESSDEGEVNYKILRNDVIVATVTSNMYNDIDVIAGTDYTYKVVAVDQEGLTSQPSNVITVKAVEYGEAKYNVTPDGRDIKTQDNKLSLQFQAGAFDQNTTVSTKLLANAKLASNKGFKILGNAYEFESDMQFAKPVIVEFSYSETEINGLDPNTLAVYYFNPQRGAWERIGGTVNNVSKTITVELEHFSQYAVMGKFNVDGKTNYPYEIYLPNEEHPENYRIHSNYNKNTDACASCHKTHTAVGASLLQWFSVYETCMACHDGTVTTTYNVVEGYIANNLASPTFGGHFGNGKEEYLSSHNVKGSVNISAAPGGNVADMWSDAFGCESCHSPHGQAGNARILHPDPNGWASKNQKYTDSHSILETTANAVYLYDNADRLAFIKGYPYEVTIKDFDKNDITNNFIVSNVGDSIYGSYTAIIPKAGYQVQDIYYVSGTASIKVRMDIAEYLQADETITHVSGLNAFCGACHVDYNTEDDIQAHRHSVGVAWNYGGDADEKYIGSNKLMKTMGKSEQYISCLTCHFAHGTSKDMWENWIGKFTEVQQDNWGTELAIKEISGSSALKRLPNMATCEACHQKGKASEGYQGNTGLTVGLIAATQDGIFTTYGADYVGVTAGKCQTCHPKQFEEWSSSKHKQIIGDGEAAIIQSAKDNWVTDGSNNGPGSIEGGQYTIDEVVYTIGFSNYQSYVVDIGGMLKVLPYQWVVYEKTWRNSTLENYEDKCIGCHSTGYNLSSGAIAIGVSCEACHGPASNHVKYSSSDKNIVTPKTLSPTYQNDLCGQCHALGEDTTTHRPFPIGYIPGEGNPLADKFNITRNDLSNFWPDGSAKGKYMEYNDFTSNGNRHYNSGITCITCHSAHGDNSNGKMLKTPGYTICATCHDLGATNVENFVDSYMPFTAQTVPGTVYNLRSHRMLRDFTYPIVIDN